MSGEQRRERSLSLIALAFYLFSFGVCQSANLRQREADLHRIKEGSDVQQEKRRLVGQISPDTHLNASAEVGPEPTNAFPGDTLSYLSGPTLRESGLVLDRLSGTVGNGKRLKSSASDSKDGYQADSTGKGDLKSNFSQVYTTKFAYRCSKCED